MTNIPSEPRGLQILLLGQPMEESDIQSCNANIGGLDGTDTSRCST